MSTFSFLLVACLITVATSRPEISENKAADTSVGQSGATEEQNPIVEYLSNRNTLPPGGKREITYLQAFPTAPSQKRQNVPKKPQMYQRDPNKTPYDNFNGFIIAGRKPEVVESPVLNLSANKTKVDVVPAVATIIRTYDEHGTLRSSLTRYEPAVGPGQLTRQQISWPYAGYFPILLKDPFLTAFHALAAGNGFSLSSLVEYGPDADICQKSETVEQHEKHLRRKRQIEQSEETGKRRVMPALASRTTRLTVSDPEKGLASIRIDNPEPKRDAFYQADNIEARANLVLPPLSTILMPPVRGYDQKKKKPTKPEKEEESEEENVGEEQEESNNQESSDAVAINPPPEGASVAEAKPVGLAIAGPGGVASSKPVAQAIVGPGGLAIARPVGTAVAGVEVEGSIPLGGKQQKQKVQKKKPKQEYDLDPDTELKYVGGLSGPIGSPKPKHTPPETNYIGGLRGVVGNPIPKYENTRPSARQFHQHQFTLGEFNGKYGFLPFMPQTDANGRTMGKRMDTPTYFHGMIGSQGNNMPASVYPLMYY